MSKQKKIQRTGKKAPRITSSSAPTIKIPTQHGAITDTGIWGSPDNKEKPRRGQ